MFFQTEQASRQTAALTTPRPKLASNAENQPLQTADLHICQMALPNLEVRTLTASLQVCSPNVQARLRTLGTVGAYSGASANEVLSGCQSNEHLFVWVVDAGSWAQVCSFHSWDWATTRISFTGDRRQCDNFIHFETSVFIRILTNRCVRTLARSPCFCSLRSATHSLLSVFLVAEFCRLEAQAARASRCFCGSARRGNLGFATVSIQADAAR